MTILDLVYPKKCLECKRKGNYVCDNCLKKVRKARFRKVDLFGKLISAWRYEGVIRKAILTLKYRFVSDIAEELIEKYLKEVKANLPKKAVLVPIPMHKKRKRWRGFNQTEELGKILSKKMGWDYSEKLLIKTKNTKPQTELKEEERRLNIKDSFLIKTNAFKNKTIVVFDDVWTTGSTLKEAAKGLSRKNHGRLIGLTMCS